MSRDSLRDARQEAAEGTRFEPEDFATEQRRDRTEVRPTRDAQERVAREQVDEVAGDLPREDDIFLPDEASGVVNRAATAQETIRGQENLRAAVGDDVDITSPTAVIEALPTDEDVEIEVRDGVETTIRADDVVEAQEALEERRETFESDPVEFIDDLDDDRLEQAGELDRSAQQARARRGALRDAEQEAREQAAEEDDDIDPDDIAVDVDRERGRVEVEGLTDDATERITERQAAEATDDVREEIADQLPGVEAEDVPAEVDAETGEVEGLDEFLESDAADALSARRELEDRFEPTRDRLEFQQDIADELDAEASGVSLDFDDGEITARVEEPAPATDRISALDRIDQVQEQRGELREEAAEQFDVEPEEVSLEFDDGQLRALGPEQPIEAGDRTILARGEDFPETFDELVDVRPGEGDAIFETDLPTTQAEAARDVRAGSRRAVEGALAPGFLSADAFDRGLEAVDLDLDTEERLGLAATGIAAPEPATTGAGTAIAAGTAAAAGASAVRDRAEIDVPDRVETERPEITTPVEADVQPAELGVDQASVDVTEIEVGDDRTAVTPAELGVGDPTDTPAEVDAPDVDAAAIVDQPGTIDGPGDFITPDAPSIDREPMSEQETETGTSPTVVDREPVRFPAEEAFEPSVSESFEEDTIEFEATEFETGTGQATRADPRAVAAPEAETFADVEAGAFEATEPGFEPTAETTPLTGPTTATTPATATDVAFEAPTVTETTPVEQGLPAEFAQPTEFAQEFSTPTPPTGGTGTGGPTPPRLPSLPEDFGDAEADGIDDEFEIGEDQFEVELEDPDFLGGRW